MYHGRFAQTSSHPMKKSVYTREYAVLVQTLREVRHEAGVTQVELAKRVGQTQSFVSKCEKGNCRLDVVQLRAFCQALGTTLPALIAKFERRLTAKKKR